MSTDGTQRLLAFIQERESIRLMRVEGNPPPWTKDKILSEYRFCNIRREDDKVTRWIHENWLIPHKDDPDVWFAMVVARFINWPDTLLSIGYPVPWNPARFVVDMTKRKLNGDKIFTGAYMVRADREHKNKFEYQEEVVFTPMWNARERLRPQAGDTLNSYHMLLGQFHGLGSFMAAQVIADVKHSGPLKEASDWYTFAASGPGSRRGLNRVLGRPKDAPWTEEEWRMELARLDKEIGDYILAELGENLDAQNLQNCLCEWDKYCRVLNGEGRPRAKYKPQFFS